MSDFMTPPASPTPTPDQGPGSPPPGSRRSENRLVGVMVAAVVALALIVIVLFYLVIRQVKEESQASASPGSAVVSPSSPSPLPSSAGVPAETSGPGASVPSPSMTSDTSVPASPPPGQTTVSPPTPPSVPVSGATPSPPISPQPSGASGQAEFKLPLSAEILAKQAPAVQTVILFTTAEQNLDPAAMVEFYAPTVMWNGKNLSRESLQGKHAAYLAKLSAYQLTVGKIEVTYDRSGNWAVVEYDVKAELTWRRGQSAGFGIRKRVRLFQSEGAWKIECEEDAEHYFGASGKLTYYCHF